MTISGLTIFKLLPGGLKTDKANCKECGYPTCMAYAMKLAKGEATIDSCKYVSDELKALLNAQNQRMQKQVSFGVNSKEIILGGETVLYRHDKTFINPTCLSVRIKTSQSSEDSSHKLDFIRSYSVERVGETIYVQSITIEDDNNSCDSLLNLVNSLIERDMADKFSVILISKEKNTLIEAASLLKQYQKPLLYLKSADSSSIVDMHSSTSLPVVVSGESVESITSLVKDLNANKINDLVLNFDNLSVKNALETYTNIRRVALSEGFTELSYPVIAFTSDFVFDKSVLTEGLWAGNLMCKYVNLVVIDSCDPAMLCSLFTLRQNLFTDPQKPLQIESKLYSIGETTPESPLLVTTNFALTYFSVAGEIEASNIPCYLLITPSDGMSVLTAWAANKFNGEVIAKAVKENKVDEVVNHRQIIISGYVNILKDDIEEELPGWSVDIAPMEASDIPEYLKTYRVTVNAR